MADIRCAAQEDHGRAYMHAICWRASAACSLKDDILDSQLNTSDWIWKEQRVHRKRAVSEPAKGSTIYLSASGR